MLACFKTIIKRRVIELLQFDCKMYFVKLQLPVLFCVKILVLDFNLHELSEIPAECR